MRKTNELSLFSKNETLDDLSSASIRYLTIPAFLAYYTSQKFEQDERLTSLKLAQVCLMNYVIWVDILWWFSRFSWELWLSQSSKTCTLIHFRVSLIWVSIPSISIVFVRFGLCSFFCSDGPASKGQLQPAKIDPEKQRNEKIRAYRERKNLEDRLEKFLSLNSPSTDEEVLVGVFLFNMTLI